MTNYTGKMHGHGDWAGAFPKVLGVYISHAKVDHVHEQYLYLLHKLLYLVALLHHSKPMNRLYHLIICDEFQDYPQLLSKPERLL